MTRRLFAVWAFALSCGTTSAFAADAVTHWNEIATTNINAAGRFPAGFIDLAKMHLAIHDAVQAFEHTAHPYCADIEGAVGFPAAAVASAARDVLVALLPPAQDAVIEAEYLAYLQTHSLSGNAGLAVGAQAAACILALRANDGSFPTPPPTFFGGTMPGEWRPTTPTPVSMVTPWLATVTPFALKSPSQLLEAAGPPKLNTGRYAREYNEVKALGAKNSVTRTAEQTELANFYSDNLVVMFQRILRTIVEAEGDDLADSARAMALANVAVTDALIAAWATKIHYNFWRPVTGIREGDNDGNRLTDGDPLWEPFIGTPNYPEYSSGANNLAAAMMRSLALVFRSDRLSFVVESKAAAAVQKFRTYERLSDVCRDMIEVRIYQGIHFRSADEVAFRSGTRAADWAVSHILRPVRGLR